MSWPGISELSAGPNRHELRCLSWDELVELADQGWEVGSHTHSHPRLTELNDEDAAAELRRSRVECEYRLGRPCLSVAYPYGDFDLRIVRLAARAGYATGAALPPPYSAETVLAWPRVGVYRVDDRRRLRLKVSKAMRRLRRSRLWPLLTRSPRRPASAGKPS
jgi:peptidoglycan/xylan/chitin deacetylase (PgdA/CDA1 family)